MLEHYKYTHTLNKIVFTLKSNVRNHIKMKAAQSQVFEHNITTISVVVFQYISHFHLCASVCKRDMLFYGLTFETLKYAMYTKYHM